MISRVTMLDVKILSRKKKRMIFRAGFILRNLFYLFERGGGEREREKGKNRVLSDQKYTPNENTMGTTYRNKNTCTVRLNDVQRCVSHLCKGIIDVEFYISWKRVFPQIKIPSKRFVRVDELARNIKFNKREGKSKRNTNKCKS